MKEGFVMSHTKNFTFGKLVDALVPVFLVSLGVLLAGATAVVGA